MPKTLILAMAMGAAVVLTGGAAVAIPLAPLQAETAPSDDLLVLVRDGCGSGLELNHKGRCKPIKGDFDARGAVIVVPRGRDRDRDDFEDRRRGPTIVVVPRGRDRDRDDFDDDNRFDDHDDSRRAAFVVVPRGLDNGCRRGFRFSRTFGRCVPD